LNGGGVEQDWKGNGWIYAMLCEVTGDWYIGSTKRELDDRLKEHLYEAERVWRKEKMEQTVLHKTMWRTGIKNWIILPLYKGENEIQLRELEKHLISKLKPNLNRRKKDKTNWKKKRNRPTKEKRKEKGTTRKEEEKNTMLWSWTTDDTEFLGFGKVIEKTQTPICWQKGLIDITDWENLKENFRSFY